MDWKYILTSYEGRINRAKFWASIGIFFVGTIIAIVIDNALGLNIGSLPYGIVYILYILASLYFIFSVYAKRWHDRDKSGWWTLIALVPLIGGIWLIVELGILEGTPGPNRYGLNPLG